MHHIDLNLLLKLDLLLQLRSVSMAARRLGASQPTVSRSLARLREMFDDPLLIRTNHGMELTQRAQDLIDPLQSWLNGANALFAPKIFDPSTLDRRFRIAATDSGLFATLPTAFARINRLAPRMRLDIRPFSENVVAQLTSGNLDFAITGYQPDDSLTYSRRLINEKSVCVVRNGHQLSTLAVDGLTLADYLRWPHISVLIGDQDVDPINDMLGKIGAQRHVIATLPYFYPAPDLLDGSDAVMTLPSRVAERFRHEGRWTILDAPVDIAPYAYWLLWHERSRRDPATMWIIDMMASAQDEQPA